MNKIELVDLGNYIENENILMNKNFADIVIENITEIMIIAKLKGLNLNDMILKSYSFGRDTEGIKEINFQMSDKVFMENFLLSFSFRVDENGFCDTMVLFVERDDFLNFLLDKNQLQYNIPPIQSSDNYSSKYIDFFIRSEEELKVAFDFIKEKL